MNTRIIATLVLFFAAFIGVLNAARAEERKLSDEEIEEASAFIFHNALFVAFHEAGHMLISELNIPVLGREEDAVDNLASITILEANTEELDATIQDAADGWFLMDEANEQPIDDMALLDTHALDAQRAFGMVCMMTGADAEYFQLFADSINFPDERREECSIEYTKVRESWETVLSPYVLSDDESASRIDVQYVEPDEDYAAVADILRSGGLLEILAEVIGGTYRLEDGIRFTARNCGDANAFWNPAEREITMCYEFADLHAGLILKYLNDQATQKE